MKSSEKTETQEVRKWICSVCGYEHEGTEPPKKCPRCGVEALYFDPVS